MGHLFGNYLQVIARAAGWATSNDDSGPHKFSTHRMRQQKGYSYPSLKSLLIGNPASAIALAMWNSTATKEKFLSRCNALMQAMISFCAYIAIRKSRKERNAYMEKPECRYFGSTGCRGLQTPPLTQNLPCVVVFINVVQIWDPFLCTKCTQGTKFLWMSANTKQDTNKCGMDTPAATASRQCCRPS